MSFPTRRRRARSALALVLAFLAGGTIAFTQVKIDVKTSLKHKEKARLAKAGLVAFLKQSDWAEVVTIGEDYAVWIENVRRKLKGNTVFFQVDLELRSRADIGAGKLIETRHIADTVDLAEVAAMKTFEEREVYRLVEQHLTKGGKLKSVTGAVTAVAGTQVPMAGVLVEQGLKYFGLDLNAKYSADEAVEGMVLGAALFTELKSMINPPEQEPAERRD